MGCTVREKHIRTNRRPKSVKQDQDSLDHPERASIPKSIIKSGVKPMKCQVGLHEPTQTLNSSHNPNLNIDDSGWGYCTEEQLEEMLLKKLEFVYIEALTKLVSLGYEEEAAVRSILQNGHCNGGMDALTNILHNSLAYLSSSSGSSTGNSEESVRVLDLKKLEERSLAEMVRTLQEFKPHLSKGDAMWCLLMSDLHMGRATAMEIPVLPSSSNGGSNVSIRVDSVSNNGGIVIPALCRFHGGWGFGNGGGSEFPVSGVFSYNAEISLQRDMPKRFTNLSPSMKSLLKRNVAMFAAGFRANSKQLQIQDKACPNTVSKGEVPVVSGSETPIEYSADSLNSRNKDFVDSVSSKFCDLSLDEKLDLVTEDQKDELIVTLLNQIKDLERQAKERQEWAHQKAMQAAKKLSNDLAELKRLRMERDDTQRAKKGKQALEDTTMKRLSEMESALRKASGQVDQANAAVKRLETENAEIRAEMEASKLSASESVTACLEAAKREKKCLKKLLAWEKKKAKLQEEIAGEKKKISELEQVLVQVRQAQKDAEEKWRGAIQAKEEALGQVEEEQRSKEASEASYKRKLEALRLKMEIDFQRIKDDLQRLEQEFARLKASAQSSELHYQLSSSPTRELEGARNQGETISELYHEVQKLEDFSVKEEYGSRECIICLKDEVSVVFLPCAHQVMCSSCSDAYGKNGKATCPCCRLKIEQRIHVFGASS